MRKFLILIITLVLLLQSSLISYAWLQGNKLGSEVNMNAYVHKSYFESGIGTSDDPYEIKYPVQYYYFTWLQYMGYFNEKNDSGEIEQVYFYLSSDLDMSDWTLPPVGTQTYPFLGNFDGNEKTISNLTIQNVDKTTAQAAANEMGLTDIPIEEAVSGVEIVGVFGVVGSLPAADYTYIQANNKVKDLTISNANITTQTTNSLAGIAVGYVNDSSRTGVLSNIKVAGESVINSTATTSLSYTNNLSDYGLVGYTNNTDSSVFIQNVEVKTPKISNGTSSNPSAIIDNAGDAGGDLVIAPSGLTDGRGTTLYQPFSGTSLTSGRREVDGAAPLDPDNPSEKSAYYSANVYKQTGLNVASGYVVYNTTLNYGQKSVQITQNGSTTLANYNSSEASFLTYKNYALNPTTYKSISNELSALYFNSVPTFPANGSSNLPQNCVWFKPLNTGHCSIAFCVQNQSSDGYVSIYRYKRENISGTKQEMKMYFPSKGGNKIKNNQVIMIDLELTDSDLGYEYCIGNSTGASNSVYFFFLKLAGTSNDGGAGIGQGIAGSKYAVYEEFNITTNRLSLPYGVSFVGDETSVFQINKQSSVHNNSYIFNSSEGSATTTNPEAVSAPGLDGQLVKNPGLTPGTVNIKIQVITGYDQNNAISIVLRKIINGTNITYEARTVTNGNLGNFTSTTEAALERYFSGENLFNSTSILDIHHKIDGENIVIPTSTITTSLTGGFNITSYTVSSTVSKETIVIDNIDNGVGYNIIVTGTGGQVN